MGTGTYAKGTTVDADKTRLQVEHLLRRHGATELASGSIPTGATVACRLQGRVLRFAVPFPKISPKDEVGLRRSQAEVRRLWRCLYLVVKAKLEAVASGLTSLDEEFLGNTVVPGTNGQTVGQWIGPALVEAHARGSATVPQLGRGS